MNHYVSAEAAVPNHLSVKLNQRGWVHHPSTRKFDYQVRRTRHVVEQVTQSGNTLPIEVAPNLEDGAERRVGHGSRHLCGCKQYAFHLDQEPKRLIRRARAEKAAHTLRVKCEARDQSAPLPELE